MGLPRQEVIFGVSQGHCVGPTLGYSSFKLSPLQEISPNELPLALACCRNFWSEKILSWRLVPNIILTLPP